MTWRFGAGAGLAGLGGATDDVGANDNVVNLNRVLGGPIVHAGVTYPVSSSVSLGIELRAAYFIADHLTYSPVSLLLTLQLG